MERRPHPVPHWWALSFDDPNQYLGDKGKSRIRDSLEEHGIHIHWNPGTRIWIVVSTVEAAITCWILGNFELIEKFSIKVNTYTPNDKESKNWIKERVRHIDPYEI